MEDSVVAQLVELLQLSEKVAGLHPRPGTFLSLHEFSTHA